MATILKYVIKQRSGVKIRRETIKQLRFAIDEYRGSKEVVILGKSENGIMIDSSLTFKDFYLRAYAGDI